jgi:hypothetical protein
MSRIRHKSTASPAPPQPMGPHALPLGRHAAGDGYVSAPHELNDLVGPFYDLEGAASVLQISLPDLRSLMTLNRILTCRTREGIFIFPTFQFVDGSLLPALDRILEALVDGTPDPWTHALWLTGHNPHLGGMTAVEWLRSGHDVESAVISAKNDASRWFH